MRDGFFRVAAATPQVKVADVETNVERIAELIREAADRGCGAVCLPEPIPAGTCSRAGPLYGPRRRGLPGCLRTQGGLTYSA